MTRHELRRPARKDTTTMSRSLDRRGLLLGAGTLLTSGVLAACSSEVEPPPAPSTGRPHEEPTPVQTTEQFARIVPEIHAAVVAADEARDVEELAPRVSGSAADFRKAAYAMIDKAEEWAEDLRTPVGPGLDQRRDLAERLGDLLRGQLAVLGQAREAAEHGVAGVAGGLRDVLRGLRGRACGGVVHDGDPSVRESSARTIASMPVPARQEPTSSRDGCSASSAVRESRAAR